MDTTQAQRVIESLRKGIPPDGFVRQFTVGRESEITRLEAVLSPNSKGALLIKANYGSGKTHLLRFIKESALEKGFAVSLITLDSSAAVRFNRMDQILGTVFRCIEVPNTDSKGPSGLFEAVLDAMTTPGTDDRRKQRLNELSSLGRWDYSTTLKSPSLYIALRAWIIGSINSDKLLHIPLEVVAWLCEPWNYYTRTTWLYERFVGDLRPYFRDPRASWQFYRRGYDTFVFNRSNYQQSWDALSDLNLLAQLAGMKGFVILVDEFEDVIYNLKRIDYQQEAFWNLFRLFSGGFHGFSFFAVTPAFVKECKKLLREKDCWDYDFSRFDNLPTFELSPPSPKELRELCSRIIHAHGIAYEWDTSLYESHPDLLRMVNNLSRQPIQDRTRVLIKEIVKVLDCNLQSD